MTNEEKYKTVEERVKAFLAKREMSSIATLIANEFAHWLALEVEEERPEPCPFCGANCEVIGAINHRVKCSGCNYESIMYIDKEKVIAAHNRVCRAVKAAGEEVRDGK